MRARDGSCASNLRALALKLRKEAIEPSQGMPRLLLSMIKRKKERFHRLVLRSKNMRKKYIKFCPKMLKKYIHKSKVLLLVAVSSTAVLFAACQREQNTSNDIEIENNQVIDSKNKENDHSDASIPKETYVTKVNPSGAENSSEQTTLLFSNLSKYQFVFSSGAGAWQTLLNINKDGTFNGYYSDSDMGDTGEGYPKGVNYSSTFKGKFKVPKRINDYTFSMAIEYINLEEQVGSEEIIDGIRYIYSEPYGLNDAKEIYIYTPQAPLRELPEGFRSWVGHMDLSDVTQEHLGFYGLYNVATESGFSSYEKDEVQKDEVQKDSLESDSIAEVEEIEKQYEKLSNQLQNEASTQSEMNFLAREMYVLWDDEINRVWRYLKDTLDKEAMDKLTSAQRKWIEKKENEVNKAGSEYEGGSIQPMVEYLKGAELTRNRVYELVELLK